MCPQSVTEIKQLKRAEKKLQNGGPSGRLTSDDDQHRWGCLCKIGKLMWTGLPGQAVDRKCFQWKMTRKWL